MMGSYQRSYQPAYRPRRSFRNLYILIFIVVVVVIWHSSTSHDRLRDIANEPQDLDLAKAPPVVHENIEVKRDRSLLTDAYDHHAQTEATSEEPFDTDEKLLLKDERRALPQKAGITDSKIKDTETDDTESEDTDDVLSLKDGSGETVNNEAKLSHPDDDESSVQEAEIPDLSAVTQQRLGGDLMSEVDNLLKADHPSSRMEKDAPEDEGFPHEGPELVDHAKHPIQDLKEQTPWTESYQFPSWDECESLKEKADALPDMLHFTFEQATKDVVLEGWEDEWVSKARYIGPPLSEPKIDFVYNWVNGSQPEFTKSMRPYELNSSLNDEDGVWIASHSANRYREWNELRYSMRSVEKYASSFTNRIQILVNAFENFRQNEDEPVTYGKQKPHWLKESEKVQVLSQEEFFGPDERKCLPTFDSLTIENQLYNTKSETDRLFALSDDMILGKPHAASDLYSPLFGPTMGFKDNAYNTLNPPTEKDAERFGEKPFLIYTSWLLNRRFGARKRKGQVHFGHSLSRSIAKEAITSFPRPALRSSMQRFRGETGFQIYSWFVIFHYTMERHREALLWSYIMLRSDTNDDGYLSWNERNNILRDLAEGLGNESPEQFRRRIYYRVGDYHEEAGLKPPMVNTDTIWTSLDGPQMIKDLDCDAFDTEDCLAPGFSMPATDATARSPIFSSAAIFDRVSRQSPRCGDCLIKLILNRRKAGLGPLLPHPVKKPEQRAIVVKALMKYQYSIVAPDAQFYMVTDSEQAEHALLKPYLKKGKKVGQMCLNDDVVTTDEKELKQLGKVMNLLFQGMLPNPSSFEKEGT